MRQAKEDRAAMGRKAVAAMGGAAIGAEKITSLSGRECSRHLLQKWMVNGIGVPWHPFVHKVSKIPLHELDPDIYPAWLEVG